MINRGNWLLIKEYLKYRGDIDQLLVKSVRLEETWLKNLLKWAEEKLFDQAPKIKPSLPNFLLSARLDGKGGTLSPAYKRKVISSARRFFEWLVRHHREYGKKITQAWLVTLKPARLPDNRKEHEAVTIEEIRAIAAAPVETIRDRRIRAAAVFWFLSGIRIGAFVTLPIKAINLVTCKVNQWPSLGVHTKLGKRATTIILNIPDLLSVVQAWDQEVRGALSELSYWFAPLSPETGGIDANIKKVRENRESRARKDLKDWLNRVGLPYHSPHKFRHGHAVYALLNSKDIGDVKAVSQNLMHSNISITDGVYGVLSSADIEKRIAGLGDKDLNKVVTRKELIEQLENIVEQLKQQSL